MRSLVNIFWLIGKEIKSTLGDPVMLVLILWSFFFAVMMEASGAGDWCTMPRSRWWTRTARPSAAPFPPR